MEEELKKIIKDNQEKLENIEEKVKKIHKKLFWSSIAGYLKALLILGPIIIGIIYLSPVVKKYFKTLEPVFQALRISPESTNLDFDNINNFFSQENDTEIINSICNPDIREEVIKQICQ